MDLRCASEVFQRLLFWFPVGLALRVLPLSLLAVPQQGGPPAADATGSSPRGSSASRRDRKSTCVPCSSIALVVPLFEGLRVAPRSGCWTLACFEDIGRSV